MQRLKALGYHVSVEHVLQVQTLFLSLSLNEIKLNELKHLLTPLIAKTKEEQDEIYFIIDEYIEQAVEHSLPAFMMDAPAALNPYRPMRYAESNDDFKIIMWVIGGFILLIAAVLIYRDFNLHHRIAEPGLAINIDSLINGKADTTVQAPTNDTVTISPPVKPVNTTGYVIEALRPVVALQRNVNVQLSVLLGLIAGVILSFIVFRTKENQYFSEEDGSKANLKSGGNSSSNAPADDVNGIDISLPVSLQFTGNNVIPADKNISSIKKYLQKTGMGTVPVFDVEKSIAGTAEKGGFYSLAYSYQREPRKYVMLVDEDNSNGHITNLFNVFIKNLLSTGVHIEKYAFTTDVFTVTDERKNIFSLKELAFIRPGFHLIIFAGCDTLWEQVFSIGDGNTIAALNSWATCACITPTPIPDWRHNERQWQQHGFALVPADGAAIDLLIKSITRRQDLATNIITKQLGHIYSVNSADFSNAAGIKAYLRNEALFKMVCALALYPRLSWAITFSFYNGLVKEAGDKAHATTSDYDALLKLARIPFLNKPMLGEGLRVMLLDNLDRETEKKARVVLHNLLQQAILLVQAGTPEQKEIDTQLLLNEFFLHAYNRKEFKKYAQSKLKIVRQWKATTDLTMANYIRSGKAKLMPKNNSGQHLTIGEFLVKERQRDVNKVNLLRVAATAVPGILMYAFLVTFKPSYAYGSDMYGQVPVTLSIKADSCSAGVNAITLQGNKIDSAVTLHLNGQTLKDTVLYNMDYGARITLQYNYKGEAKTMDIDCKDSSYNITLINCR